MKRQRAKVTWVSPEDGGRVEPPSGPRYATIARFPNEDPHWPDGAWTVVFDFEPNAPQRESPTYGYASFLMPDAPRECLHLGAVFELHEGLRRVAVVEILADSGQH
jgi:hypothetical protein